MLKRAYFVYRPIHTLEFRLGGYLRNIRKGESFQKTREIKFE